MTATRCPRRIEEGGVEGTRDLGFCMGNCAAFDPYIPIETIPITAPVELIEGYCKEYFTEVVAWYVRPI